jgi:hypothetical protein
LRLIRCAHRIPLHLWDCCRVNGALTLLVGESASSGSGLGAAPIIAVAGVVVGALIAGGVRLVGDQVARRAESQRQAVYQVQEAALDLRSALRGYGSDGARPTAASENAIDLANGKLDLLVHRINETSLRLTVDDWRKLAELYSVGDPFVTNLMEENAWKTIHYQSGRYVRHIDRSRWLK